MASTTIRMPQLGESVVEGTVGKWLVQVGQRIERDQAVVEILTDKADSEVPSPEAGVVTKILVNEGDVIAVGEALCEVDTARAPPLRPDQAAAGRRKPQRPLRVRQPPTAAGQTRAVAGERGQWQRAPRRRRRRRRPRCASSRASRASTCNKSRVRGEGGRVTRDDVLRATGARSRPSRSAACGRRRPRSCRRAAAARGSARGTIAVSGWTGRVSRAAVRAAAGDEVVPFSRRRRIIADHMVYSKLTAPHVVTVAEVRPAQDRRSCARRTRIGSRSEGVGLTMLAFVGAATARALREHRAMNARMLDDSYVLLGTSTSASRSTPPEGLVVPVVKRADELSVRGLARAIDDDRAKARDSKITPDDLAGKTFSICNPGLKGNLFGGAIISQPNVGILRMGEIKKRVVVIERRGRGPDGDSPGDVHGALVRPPHRRRRRRQLFLLARRRDPREGRLQSVAGQEQPIEDVRPWSVHIVCVARQSKYSLHPPHASAR